jgi:hypothetical protein
LSKAKDSSPSNDQNESRNLDNTDIDFGLDFNTPKGNVSLGSQENDPDDSVFLPDTKKIKSKAKRYVL